MAGKIAMLFAEGFEEAEAVIVADVLRRLNFEVTLLAADNQPEVSGAHGMTLKMEGTLASARPENYAAAVLPGGMPGSARLRDNPAVTFRQTAIVIRAEFMERRVRLEPELLIDITSGFRRIQAECTAVLQNLHEFFQHH